MDDAVRAKEHVAAHLALEPETVEVLLLQALRVVPAERAFGARLAPRASVGMARRQAFLVDAAAQNRPPCSGPGIATPPTAARSARIRQSSVA